jgi:hypothetical protein
MIDSDNFYLVRQIAELLEKKLDLKVKDHGMWRIQCLIHDTIEEKEYITTNKEKEKIHLA